MIGLVTDGDAITWEVIESIGKVKLLANGLVAGQKLHIPLMDVH